MAKKHPTTIVVKSSFCFVDMIDGVLKYIISLFNILIWAWYNYLAFIDKQHYCFVFPDILT